MIDRRLLSFGEVKEMIEQSLGPKMIKLDDDTFSVISKNKETLEALIQMSFENAQNELIANMAVQAMHNSTKATGS